MEINEYLFIVVYVLGYTTGIIVGPHILENIKNKEKNDYRYKERLE